MTTADILALLAIILLAVLGLVFLPAWMARRNMRKVVKILLEKGATGIQNAMTVDNLGLRPKSLLQRIGGPRDWKPKALDLLIQSNVVLMTQDGKLYVTESSLANAAWLKPKK
ncbi:MAG: hypothetical protein Q7T04_00330 [Dehalococcoidia bacterium]|nr:hypothetical protein [Dehalococcoidia bacterium]